MPGFWWLLPLLLQSFKVEGEIRAGFCNGPNIGKNNLSSSPFPVPLNDHIHNVTVLIFFFKWIKIWELETYKRLFFFFFLSEYYHKKFFGLLHSVCEKGVLSPFTRSAPAISGKDAGNIRPGFPSVKSHRTLWRKTLINGAGVGPELTRVLLWLEKAKVPVLHFFK